MITILVSCVSKNTGYRLVGKNGRVIYLEKKRPTFNQEKLKEKEEIKKQNNKIQQLNNEIDKQIIRVNEDNKINDNLLLESNAYSIKSVIDTMVDNKDINNIARIVEKSQKPKTIKDFKIPESYFNSKQLTEETTVIVNNSINNKKINLNDINNTANNSNLDKNKENKELESNNKKKKSLFEILFSHNKEDNKSQLSKISENKKTINDLKVTSPLAVKAVATKNVDVNNSIVKNSNNSIKKDDIIKKNEIIKNEFFKSKEDKNENTKNLNNNLKKPTQNQTKTKNIIDDGLIKNKYYIQLGSYNDKKKAYNIINNFKSFGKEQKIVPVSFNNQLMHRAVIGTFDTKVEAEKVMEQIIEKGHFDVFVFKK